MSKSQIDPLPSFLPCASVDTTDQAEGIQVWLCRLSRSDNHTYYLNSFDGTLDGVQKLGFVIEHLYREQKGKPRPGKKSAADRLIATITERAQ